MMKWYKPVQVTLTACTILYMEVLMNWFREEKTMRGKKMKGFLFLVCIIVLSIAGCDSIDNQQGSGKENQTGESNTVTQEPAAVEDVDYGKYFDGLNGGAVFYNISKNKYYIYNKEICERRDSPCSTFKIISTLMGVHEKILTRLDSKMAYDGTIYTMDAWNADLGLCDAFKTSCVWYFRKVIDQAGKEKVKQYLTDLKFGNCDISKWNGTGDREPAELNGFWLGSSLKISPMEWVNVLTDIWNGKTVFTKDDIDMLVKVMATEDDSGITVYGKTGTGGPDEDGKVDNGWYVGVFKLGTEAYTFAVHLTEPASKDISGPKASMITSKIIQNEFINYNE